MGKLIERRKTNHENHDKGKNCFRDKGTRKQSAETPKLTPMDKSTSRVVSHLKSGAHQKCAPLFPKSYLGFRKI